MTKRTYNRRSDDQIIEDLEAEIQRIKKKVEAERRTDEPVVKEFPKLKKKLAGFSQMCLDHGRADISNSVLAFMTTLELQVKQPAV